MKGCTTWSYFPYRPFLWNVGDIYVSRVAPSLNAIHLEWLPLDNECEYEIFCRKRGVEEYESRGKTTSCEFDIFGLESETDYEFYVACKDKKNFLD